MKKLIAILLIICTLLSFTACDVLYEILGEVNSGADLGDNDQKDDGKDDTDSGGDGTEEDTGKKPGGNKPGDGSDNTDTPDDGKDEPTSPQKTYNDFTMSEKAIFAQYVGAVIPFIPNNEYYVHGYYEESDYENGINFYTVGNTEEEYLAYLELYSDYELCETYVDEYGDTWYCYAIDDAVAEVCYYLYDGKYFVDVYVYRDAESDSGDEGDIPAKIKEWQSAYDCITVSEALALCLDYVSAPSTERYYIIATVTEVQDTTYGQLTVADETGSIMVYGTRSEDGSLRYDAMGIDLAVGDMILIYGTLQNYKGNTKEVQNAWLIDYYSENADTSGNGGDNDQNNHRYTSFTSQEKALFNTYFGFCIPFIPNDEYYLEEYSFDYGDYIETGLNFYTYGNTKAEFNSYLTLLSSYTLTGTEVDEYGDTWYYYEINSTVMLDISYYEVDGNEYVIDLYVFTYSDSDVSGGDDGGSGDTGGGSNTDYDVITNQGAGLPSDKDGVYDVDFTDADKVKDVTDQGSYLGGCPTTGSPAVLVIPVEFTDSRASAKGYTTDKLVSAFSMGGNTDYYSVYDYYYISSYGKLTLDITVLDYWFCPQYESSYYYSATYDYYGENIMIGDQLVLDEALAYLSKFMDLSQFDSDNNGIIDSVVLVNTLDVGEEDFYWAYRYWNIYTDDYGYFYEYDSVSANDYIWASYQFLYQTADDNGEIYYDEDLINTYTFIHEFAHVLGLDDYYDTEYVSDPMNGLDVMDVMQGDHNPYSKFNLGWITSSRLVVTDSSVTLTLEAFAKGGDTIIIANNWDPTLGVYQEYYVIMYYTGEGLNGGDNAGYFVRDSIVVYHVNASLYKEVYEGETYYDVYNNNTDPSSSYGTEDNLIEYVKSAAGNYTYVEGDTIPTVTDDNGNALSYTFVVDSINGDYATITVSAR